MKFTDYAKVDAVNWSTLREMARSPQHYKYRREHGREDTKSFARGRAAHTAVMEPRRFLLEYAVWDRTDDEGKAKQRRGKDWDAFKAQCSGKTILTVAEYETALAIGDAVRAHPVAALVLDGAKHEQSITWTDKDTGLLCKARIDIIGRWLADLKTTGDANVRKFGNIAAKYNYIAQVAMYSDGWFAVTGDRPPQCFVVAETEPPHAVAVFPVDDDQFYMGQEIYKRLLAQVATCTANNEWPGPYPVAEPLSLPAWVYDEDEQELTATVVDEEAA